MTGLGATVFHMDMNDATAKAIQAERAIADQTVRELSERSGIPLTSLMRVLKGSREIKVNQLAQIAGALDIYPHEIVEHAENLLAREAEHTLSVVTQEDLTISAKRGLSRAEQRRRIVGDEDEGA